MENKQQLERLERKLGILGVVEALSERLKPSELTTLLLEVYRRQAAKRTPAQVFQDYEQDRFVRPAHTPFSHLLEWDNRMVSSLPAVFEVMTLSPVCPLGTSSVVANVSQDKAVTTSRNSEVVSDVTNVLSLEVASRRKKYLQHDVVSSQTIHLATHHRLVRPQFFSGAGQFAHFALFALVSGGRASAGSSFELETMLLHLRTHLGIIRTCCPNVPLRVTVSDFSDRDRLPSLETAVLEPLRRQFANLNCEADQTRTQGRGYYMGLAFQIYAQQQEELFLVDGGEVDWTQKYLSNAKERLMISGMGSERVIGLSRENAK